MAADGDLPNVETMTMAYPDPRMAAEHWTSVFVGLRFVKNGTGPMRRNATVRNIFPVIDTTVGYFILSHT